MKANKKFMIEMLAKDETLGIFAAIEEEIKQNVVRCNGDNNAKECEKSLKGRWQYSYNSTGRNLVRMWWLTKFMTKLLENLINNTEMTLVQAC